MKQAMTRHVDKSVLENWIIRDDFKLWGSENGIRAAGFPTSNRNRFVTMVNKINFYQ